MLVKLTWALNLRKSENRSKLWNTCKLQSTATREISSHICVLSKLLPSSPTCQFNGLLLPYTHIVFSVPMHTFHHTISIFVD